MGGRVLAAALAALAIAGCGGGDGSADGGGGGGGGGDSKQRDSDGRYSAPQVIDHFKSETGQTLQLDAKETPGWDELLPVGGSYSIYVTHDDAATQRVMRGPDPRARPEPPDARGVVWVRVCPPGEDKGGCFWAGSRRFGKNVVLGTAGDSKRLPRGVTQAIDALKTLR